MPAPRTSVIDPGLLRAAAELGDILSLLARHAPGPVADALSREVALVVFPRDGHPVPFRIQFCPPDRVAVVPGDVDVPLTRIACTREALRRWVRGDLDLAEARARRMFFVRGDPTPFRALVAALDAQQRSMAKPAPVARMSVAAAMSARFSPA